MTPERKPTACILCSENCGIEVHTAGRNLLTPSGHCDPFTKVPYHKNVPARISKAHPHRT